MLEREEFEAYILRESDMDVTDIDWDFFENGLSLEDNLKIQKACQVQSY